MCFVFCIYFGTDGFRFVGDHVSDFRECPLMQLLIGFFAIVYRSSYVLYITNNNRFYFLSFTGRNKPRRDKSTATTVFGSGLCVGGFVS